MMTAVEVQTLLTSDRFKEVTDQPKDKPARLLKINGSCPTEPNNIHINTSRGDWCIARGQIVLLVE